MWAHAWLVYRWSDVKSRFLSPQHNRITPSWQNYLIFLGFVWGPSALWGCELWPQELFPQCRVGNWNGGSNDASFPQHQSQNTFLICLWPRLTKACWVAESPWPESRNPGLCVWGSLLGSPRPILGCRAQAEGAERKEGVRATLFPGWESDGESEPTAAKATEHPGS